MENIVNCKVEIFRTPLELAETFALNLADQISEIEREHLPVTVALSGGTTPVLLFSVLAEKYSSSVNWKHIHFFWVDERCVPPDDPESNYGTTFRQLFSRINIPETCIHRINGELDPAGEAKRYSGEIIRYTRSFDNLPVFDHLILGMGEDGHTASIFPGNENLMHSEKICEVAEHPVSGQKRITITGKVINNADNITFIVTGRSKAQAIEQLFKKNANLPASLIAPGHGKIKWLLDEKAAMFLDPRTGC